MRQVQEVIYVVPEERDEYLQKHLNPTEKVSQLLWMHGVRNQYYFMLNEVILVTFDYVGNDFYNDMAKLAAYPEINESLVQTRRRDVPADQLRTTSWWAPLKRLGGIVTENPFPDNEKEEKKLEEMYREMIGGVMSDEESAMRSVTTMMTGANPYIFDPLKS